MDRFFNEAIRAQNTRKLEVLSRMAPNKLVGADGAPQSENAAATIFNLEQEQAEKLAKTRHATNAERQRFSAKALFAFPLN